MSAWTRGRRGLVIADILRTWGGGGVSFLQFCADVFYEQPLKKITVREVMFRESKFTFFSFRCQSVLNFSLFLCLLERNKLYLELDTLESKSDEKFPSQCLR